MMLDSACDLVLVTVDASMFAGKEASIYGTPVGLRNLATTFRDAIDSNSQDTRIISSPDGSLVESGVDLEICLTDDINTAARRSFRNTLRFRKAKKRFYNDDEVEYTTRQPSRCSPRADGGFAVAFPDETDGCSLVISGNPLGLHHIADSLDGMADVVYEPYNPNWPENSEHYHSWFDGNQDVMLDCGLGLVTGRLDHRKDGSVSWILDGRSSNREALKSLYNAPKQSSG